MKKESLCSIPDCPEHTGGRCFSQMRPEEREIVRELRTTRNIYRIFQTDGLNEVSEMGWRMIMGVIEDRLEQLTGTRI